MNKKEADQIILACKKHKIEATIKNILDDYTVTFTKKLRIQNFEAAKLIVNALVIEGRNTK